jgi:putrescine aminotransferase
MTTVDLRPNVDATATGAVFDAIRRHHSPGAALSAKFFGAGAVEVAAEGAAVWLSDGRCVLDFGSYAVTLLGHRHCAVVDAVIAQLNAMPTSTRGLANPTTAAFVAALAERVGGGLQHVWLGSNGADAVEVALKLARRVSGRERVLAVEGAFHGKTLGALALTWNPIFRAGLEPLLSHVTHIGPRDFDAVAREAAHGDVAALILEPIQGESGVIPLSRELMRRWARDAHAAGLFLISDEIQVGLTRCGPVSLAIDAGLHPDALLLGKALGGGVLPLSAMLATDELYSPLSSDPTWHSLTFAGHPLSCAAGLASLTALEGLAERRVAVERGLCRHLRELARSHSKTICEIRGRGLLWGIELAGAEQAGDLLLGLARRGLLVSPCLGSAKTIRLTPPITTSEAQLDQAMEMLSDALEDCWRQT